MGSGDDDGRQRDEAFAVLLRSGDVAAFGLLFDSWADPVYDRISNRWFTTADAARIEADAFVATHRRLAQQGATDPFRVLVLRATSQAMVAAADQRVDLRMPVGPYAEDRLTRGADARTLAADPAVAALLWESAEVLGPQVRDVLDLHFRHHLTPAEVAAVMQESTASIEAILGKVEAGYGAVVRARIMWRQGAPNHDVLAVAVAGHDGFDTAVVKLVADHLRNCEQCRAASQVPVPPIAVFAAIPVAIAPPGFKDGVVEALGEAGLPMDSSASSLAARRRTTSIADQEGAAAAAVAAVASRPTSGPAPEALAASVPALGDEQPAAKPTTGGRNRGRGRARARDDKAAETGLAVGLAAFAGPAEGAAAHPDPSYTPEPGQASGSIGGDDDAAGSGSGGRSRRMWLLAAVAAVAVVVGLAVVLLGGSGSTHHDAKLATAGDERTTTTEVTTTVTTPGESTTVPPVSVAPTTVAAPGASTTSTTAKSTTTTAAAKSPAGKAAPTTTVSPFFPGLTRSFGFNAGTVNTPHGFWLTSAAGAPQLTWSVTASTSVSVVVSGPGFSSTQASGSSSDLCPGTLSGDTCTVSPGTYDYTLTVSDGHGHSIPETLTLTVNGPAATTTTVGP